MAQSSRHHPGDATEFGHDDRQIMPTRRGLPVGTGGLEEWEEELGLTEGIWSGLKKQPINRSPTSNYRQYIPHLPDDEDYHQKVKTPADWYGADIPSGSTQRIDEALVMYNVPMTQIIESIKLAAIEKDKKKRKNASFPFIGMPMIFNSTGADPNHQSFDPYYEDPNLPGGRHKNPHRMDYVPTKKEDDGSVFSKASMSSAPGRAVLGDEKKFINPSTASAPAPGPSRLGRKVGGNDEEEVEGGPGEGTRAKRKVTTYSRYNPNKKRVYTWKHGSAPERRLGHKKYPKGHKFFDQPRKGEYVVSREGDDEEGEEEE